MDPLPSRSLYPIFVFQILLAFSIHSFSQYLISFYRKSFGSISWLIWFFIIDQHYFIWVNIESSVSLCQDMWLYLSEKEKFNDFSNENALIWHETSIPYAVWGPTSIRSLSLKYIPSEVLLNIFWITSITWIQNATSKFSSFALWIPMHEQFMIPGC